MHESAKSTRAEMRTRFRGNRRVRPIDTKLNLLNAERRSKILKRGVPKKIRGSFRLKRGEIYENVYRAIRNAV